MFVTRAKEPCFLKKYILNCDNMTKQIAENVI